MNSQSFNNPQEESKNFGLYDDVQQKPRTLFRKNSYSQPQFNYDYECQISDYQMKNSMIQENIEDKSITCQFENECFKITIPELKFKDLIMNLLGEKQFVDFSKTEFKWQIQKQLINLIIKILYVTSDNQNFKEALRREAQSVIERWFALIETNKKFKAGDRNLSKLEELNQHQIFKEWQKNKKKQIMNDNLYGFKIQFFNEQLKKINCDIQIQKTSQISHLIQQIKGIETYLWSIYLGRQEQEFMFLQLSAFKEYIFLILMEKFQIQYNDQMEQQQVLQIENQCQEENFKKKSSSKKKLNMKRSFNFNTQNLIQLMKDSSIKTEYSKFKLKLQTEQQFKKQLMEILNITENAPSLDNNRTTVSPLDTLLEMIDKKFKKIEQQEDADQPKHDGNQRKKVKS